MIYTKRKNLERYLGQSESLDTAIRYLLSADLRQLVKGRNEIDGDKAFVNRFDYQTMTPEQAIWEGHIQYGDIHVLLSGQEMIGVTNVDMLKGLLCGLHAGNYDITNVYIDNLYKTVGTDRASGEEFILWCAQFAEANQMNITITVSDDPALASEAVKKYL